MNEKGNKYAIAALKHKRATLAGEIIQLERQARAMRDSLSHIDATLRLLNPDCDVDKIPNKRTRSPKNVRLFKQGELQRLILSEFREANGKPVSSKAIVDRVMGTIDVPSSGRHAIVRRITSNLAYMKRRGKVEPLGLVRGVRMWRLV